MKAIILKGNKFLNDRYQWTDKPIGILVPEWHFPAALKCAPDATGWTIVDDTQPIDLDGLEVMPL